VFKHKYKSKILTT